MSYRHRFQDGAPQDHRCRSIPLHPVLSPRERALPDWAAVITASSFPLSELTDYHKDEYQQQEDEGNIGDGLRHIH